MNRIAHIIFLLPVYLLVFQLNASAQSEVEISTSADDLKRMSKKKFDDKREDSSENFWDLDSIAYDSMRRRPIRKFISLLFTKRSDRDFSDSSTPNLDSNEMLKVVLDSLGVDENYAMNDELEDKFFNKWKNSDDDKYDPDLIRDSLFQYLDDSKMKDGTKQFRTSQEDILSQKDSVWNVNDSNIIKGKDGLSNIRIDESDLKLDLQQNKEVLEDIQVVEKKSEEGLKTVNEAKIISDTSDDQLLNFKSEYEQDILEENWPLSQKYKNSYLLKYNQLSDSVKAVNDQILTEKERIVNLKPPVVTMQNMSSELLSELDSLRPDLPVKEKLTRKSDSLQVLLFDAKKHLELGSFRELIIGLNDNDRQAFSITPNIGFSINPKMSLGLGISMDFNTEKEIALTIGYRSLIRYNLYESIFFQFESTHYFKGISNPLPGTETTDIEKYEATAAAGFGGVYNIFSTVGITFQVLYNFIEPKDQLNTSPILLRAGINF